jgi:hypothetical protein
MLALTLSVLLATAPVPVPRLKAGTAEPEEWVWLHVEGLLAPARPEAGLFLYGKLSTSARPLRALLLRSKDGGAHWTEVLPEEENSEVLFLTFLGCEGRALVGWSTEGPGELTLYTSKDCGATWARRSKLPKAVWSEWPHSWSWKSSRDGTVWLQDMNAEDAAPLRAIATRDGGRTWKSTEEPQPPAQARPEAAPSEAIDAKGTRWVLTRDEQAVRLERHEQGAPSQVRAELPVNWERKGSRLVPKR